MDGKYNTVMPIFFCTVAVSTNIRNTYVNVRRDLKYVEIHKPNDESLKIGPTHNSHISQLGIPGEMLGSGERSP